MTEFKLVLPKELEKATKPLWVIELAPGTEAHVYQIELETHPGKAFMMGRDPMARDVFYRVQKFKGGQPWGYDDEFRSKSALANGLKRMSTEILQELERKKKFDEALIKEGVALEDQHRKTRRR